jgi:hypothetical protein
MSSLRTTLSANATVVGATRVESPSESLQLEDRAHPHREAGTSKTVPKWLLPK